MFPPVHAGVAYLLYAAYTRVRDGDPPTGLPTLVLVFAAVLPDLIDQPLYYALDLPSTRTLAHSLLVAVPFSLVILAAIRRSKYPDAVGTAFAVGYLSHPVADAVWPLALGLYDELGFLLWPLTHSPAYEGQKALLAAGDVTVTTLWVELVLLAVALVVWGRDGAPGLEIVRRRLAG